MPENRVITPCDDVAFLRTMARADPVPAHALGTCSHCTYAWCCAEAARRMLDGREPHTSGGHNCIVTWSLLVTDLYTSKAWNQVKMKPDRSDQVFDIGGEA